MEKLKPQDLRIGNYVECFGIRQISAIKENKIKVYHENDAVTYSEWCPTGSFSLKPIPLTEQWLIDLGYKKLEGHTNHFYIAGHIIFVCNDLFLDDKNGIIFKYIHKLQNFVYELSDVELTLNKTK